MNEYDGFVALRVTLFLLFPCSWVIGGGGLAANNGGELYPLVVADVVYLIYISLIHCRHHYTLFTLFQHDALLYLTNM